MVYQKMMKMFIQFLKPIQIVLKCMQTELRKLKDIIVSIDCLNEVNALFIFMIKSFSQPIMLTIDN